MPQGSPAKDTPLVEAAAIPAGENSGTATLVAGTVTVPFTKLTLSSRIFLTLKTFSGGALTVNFQALNRVVGTSFDIQANVAAGTINAADGSTVDWFVIP